MQKMKKIVIAIIILLIAILTYTTISKAYSVEESVSIKYSDYINDPNLFCVEHKQSLRGTLTYKVISEVDINGNVSTDHTGKEINSWYNAKLAYILSGDNGANKESGPVQNAIWNYMYTWMKNVGQYHAGLYDGFASTSKGNDTNLDSESSDYANQFRSNR